jgi:hypothetical protein
MVNSENYEFTPTLFADVAAVVGGLGLPLAATQHPVWYEPTGGKEMAERKGIP